MPILGLLRFARGGECSERKGPLPTPALSRAGAQRAAEPISKVRPDAEEILRLVLARLDDAAAATVLALEHDGPGIFNVAIAIGIAQMPGDARLTRSIVETGKLFSHMIDLRAV